MIRACRYAVALACAFFVLVLPDQPFEVVPLRFARLPVELPILVLALMLIPWRRMTIWIAAGALATLAALKLANLVAYGFYGRAFNLLVDPGLLGTALETIAMGQGWLAACALAIAGIVIVLGAIASFRAVTRELADIPIRLKWLASAVAGALLIAAFPLANTGLTGAQWPVTSTEASAFLRERATSIIEGLRSNRAFAADLAAGRLDDISPGRTFAGLKGHDVVVVFAEAYGRFALSDSAHADKIARRLHDFEATLSRVGLSAQSAWLTSPTFGGQSWLAHGTVMSGLWLDNQHRYESMFLADRGTLIRDFARGGWRTVAIMPEITARWIESSWFGYDVVYDYAAIQYAGQPFDYMTMPDQFALATLARRELTPGDRAPVFAEVALVSSHFPWTPLPRLVAWNEIGDGRIFNDARTLPREIDWLDRDQMKRDYADAIDYALATLASFAETYGSKNLVMIIVGDHQPMAIADAATVGHDVPVHLIAGDPAVFDAVASWGWREGMVPDQNAPAWRMDAMRERLHQAFTPEARP